jgi:phospholipid/cholesterol/gamma-HCH transport system substrate-binding protein
VRVHIWIKEGVAVPVDSNITINQLGLLGEKYLEIIAGTSKELVQNDGVLTGHDPVPIDQIAQRVNALTTKIEMVVDNVNSGILTAKNEKSLADTLAAFSAVGTDLKEGRGTVGRLLTDESIYNNLEELTADLKSNPWKLLYRPKSK